MLQSTAQFLIAFILSLALSRVLRRSLFWLRSRERKPGKEKLHRLFPKPRRPLGGGLAMMIAATASLLFLPIFWRNSPRPEAFWVLAVAWAYASIGLVDDIRKAGGRGLRARPKFLLQLAAALAFGILLWAVGGRGEVRVPFLTDPVLIGPFYALFAALVIVATANAVNLSDGMDGLAAGGLVIALVGLATIGYLDPMRAVGPIAWPLCGATLGFLVFNYPPAKLLMGDTGALGLGAALGAAALFAQAEFWLLLLAAPFVVNAASVIVQMGTVRGLWRIVKPLRHDRTEPARPFLCTPLHHHFQWLAWPDMRILALYWGFGALMAAWALISLNSGIVWLIGVGMIPTFLLAAALQKTLRGNYFIALAEQSDQPDQPAVIALYRGLPVVVLQWRLYQLISRTKITESMLVGATTESILWRPMSEVEAHILLGRIYADHRLGDEALEEWEQVPTRNLLLRPSVIVRMARIYYGRDKLLDAIKLWEQLPSSRLADMPNLREVVRSAKLRLADVAAKSHRQATKMARQPGRSQHDAERLEAHLSAARRLNQELLSLLLYESDKVRGRAADPPAARGRRELLRHSRQVVLDRIRELDEALAALARAAPVQAAQPEMKPAAIDAAQRITLELGIPQDALLQLLAQVGHGLPEITQAAIHPKASRNAVYRLNLRWLDTGPSTVILKLYAADRIGLFASCYRREEGVLRLLHQYGCAVPKVYAGEMWDDRALLLFQDMGDETLAERLEASEPTVKRQWLRSAVTALAALHGVAHDHIRELTAEIKKVEKDVLGPDYYLNALRIAVGRLAELTGEPVRDQDWDRLTEQAGPLIDLLSERLPEFIHFEFTPHHLLIVGQEQTVGQELAPAPQQGLFAFDFEQATLGPLEFDLAALLAQPESDLRQPADWQALIEQYTVTASESGLPIPPSGQFERAVAYAALLKCLTYAGAAANFLGKFGGEHHLQRLQWYINTSQAIMQRWPPLRPLAQLLALRFRAARAVATRAK